MVRFGTQPFFMQEQIEPPIPWPKDPNILGPGITIICICCLICNVYVGLNLTKRKKSMADTNYQQAKVYFAFTMCVFINQLLTCISQLLFSYSTQTVLEMILLYQFIISDLSSLLPAWALFLTSSTLRKAVYEVVGKDLV
ncbi:hypothetical protein FO519_009567, partial [Halicephalobus sp. NKZ332]